MSVMTDKVPLGCPRAKCTGSCYAELAPALGDGTRFYVFRTLHRCDGGHLLTSWEWNQVDDSAQEVARLWSTMQATAGSVR